MNKFKKKATRTPGLSKSVHFQKHGTHFRFNLCTQSSCDINLFNPNTTRLAFLHLISINWTSSIKTNMLCGSGRGEGDNTENICFSISTDVLKKDKYSGLKVHKLNTHVAENWISKCRTYILPNSLFSLWIICCVHW